MQRRHLIAAASLAPFISLSATTALAQVHDLSDAINKAGRQRMLSQRMSKAWLALVHGTEKSAAQQVLDKSIALFDRQLVELKAFAPTADIKTTYSQMEPAWSEFKAGLVGKAPERANAAAVLALDSKLLALAQQGTSQYEAALGKPLGKLVNVAGRQRMLSQRMAKLYLSAMLPLDASAAAQEISKARSEFIAAMEMLKNAPEATARIKSELQLADSQWVFFDAALQKLQGGNSAARSLSEIFVSSENLLSVMDNVTGLYSAIKT